MYELPEEVDEEDATKTVEPLGVGVGATVGMAVGTVDGFPEGPKDGTKDGTKDGKPEGTALGASVAFLDFLVEEEEELGRKADLVLMALDLADLADLALEAPFLLEEEEEVVVDSLLSFGESPLDFLDDFLDFLEDFHIAMSHIGNTVQRKSRREFRGWLKLVSSNRGQGRESHNGNDNG